MLDALKPLAETTSQLDFVGNQGAGLSLGPVHGIVPECSGDKNIHKSSASCGAMVVLWVGI